MKKLFMVAVVAMAFMCTSCEQSKEDYIKEFKAFVEEVAEEGAEYTEEQWEDAAKEFEALVKKAEKYEDLTTEEKLELAAIQAQYAGQTAKKGFKKAVEDVKNFFKGDKK